VEGIPTYFTTEERQLLDDVDFNRLRDIYDSNLLRRSTLDRPINNRRILENYLLAKQFDLWKYRFNISENMEDQLKNMVEQLNFEIQELENRRNNLGTNKSRRLFLDKEIEEKKFDVQRMLQAIVLNPN